MPLQHRSAIAILYKTSDEYNLLTLLLNYICVVTEGGGGGGGGGQEKNGGEDTIVKGLVPDSFLSQKQQGRLLFQPIASPPMQSRSF